MVLAFLFFCINSVAGDMFLILHFVSNVLRFIPENTVHQSTTIKLVRYIKKGHSCRWWFLVSTICVMFIPGEMIKIMILTCASFSTGWLKDCQTTTYIHTLYAYIYIYICKLLPTFFQQDVVWSPKKGLVSFRDDSLVAPFWAGWLLFSNSTSWHLSPWLRRLPSFLVMNPFIMLGVFVPGSQLNSTGRPGWLGIFGMLKLSTRDPYVMVFENVPTNDWVVFPPLYIYIYLCIYIWELSKRSMKAISFA